MKVLIISHNVLSSYQNMGKSMSALFSAFSKEELCQLYIYPTLPELDVCSSYFRITDKDVLKSYYKFKVNGREFIQSDVSAQNCSMFENTKDESIYRNRKNHTASRIIGRDLMWKFSHWFNKELKAWLCKEKPTHIFVAPGQARFIYDIALKISKKYNLPIVTYICDEYYFVKKQGKLLKRLQVALLKSKMRKLIGNSKCLITISRELQDAYAQEFNIPATTIMTGSNYPIAESVARKENMQSITYLGNIRCNRFNSLVEIGQALNEINSELGTDYKLKIYTAEKDNGILDKLKAVKSIELCGFIVGDEFKSTLDNSDLLLHTEAFDKESMEYVKHSVSTKIADSLGSGVCLVAYGPANVSSMQHLIRNDCAIIATNQNELHSVLKEALTNIDRTVSVAKKGLIVAEEFHNSFKTSKQLYEILESIDENIAN